jgi:hypothetical protein
MELEWSHSFAGKQLRQQQVAGLAENLVAALKIE